MKGEVKIVGVIKAERRAGFFLRCDCEENKRLPEPGNTCSSQTGAKLESWRLGMERKSSRGQRTSRQEDACTLTYPPMSVLYRQGARGGRSGQTRLAFTVLDGTSRDCSSNCYEVRRV